MENEASPSDSSYPQDYTDVRTLLSWTAPGRPWRKKGREFYASALLIFFFIEVIVFLFAQYQLMLAVAAITFLSMVLSLVPPKDFHYRISTEGVKVEDHFYIWGELYDFFFKKIDKVDTLIIRTEALIPGELRLTLGNVSRDHTRRVLINFLPYREVVRQTFMEKSGEWLSKNFPLDKSS
ncbi:MAG: hypothetical protein KBC00_04450 [Candidatus Levybacteria bacterium]|nr:hypothetical protein [Candidatus Levybacteria bacterium]MBP9815111.1 hypothetical protein [Candidatus Levybacteria bacterium]